MWRIIPLLVAIGLLAPTVLAASTRASVEGDLRFEGAPGLEGRLIATAHKEALLDLAPTGSALEGIRLDGSRASVSTYRYEVNATGPPGMSVTEAPPEREERRALPAGRLEEIRCLPVECLIVVFPLDGVVGLETGGGWSSGVLGEERVYKMPGSKPKLFEKKASADWLVAAPRTPARGVAEGAVGLFLWNATATWASHDGVRETLHAGVTRTHRAGPADVPLGERVDHAAIALSVVGGALATGEGNAMLLARDPTYVVDGKLTAARTSGTLRVGDRLVTLDRESLLLLGTFNLESRGEQGAVVVGPLPLQGESSRARLAGEADEVLVAGAPVGRGEGDARALAAVAGGAASLALALGGVAVLAGRAGVFAALYSRIGPSTVFGNPNRRRLFELVDESPGASVPDLMRASSLTEVVVRHHLRILEAHRLVTVQREGRRKGYFSAATLPQGADPTAFLTLRDETRRSIAAAIAAGAATQRDIATLTGTPRRLVSYHLGHLERHGLVSGAGTFPRRYAPTSALRMVLSPDAQSSRSV